MASEHPHIILIMTDQQRFDTIGAWGYEHMVTPHQDRLVREGVSFRQAYCPGATCVRNRARQYAMRWPTKDDAALHGRSTKPKQVDYL